MNVVLFSMPLSTEAPLQIALLVGWQHRAVLLGEKSTGLAQRAEHFYSTCKMAWLFNLMPKESVDVSMLMTTHLVAFNHH